MLNPSRRHLLYAFFLLALCLVSSGLLAACAQNTASAAAKPTTPTRPAPPQATITTIDFAYQMPATLSTGYVDLTLVNNGAEQHEAQFVLLNDGVSFDQFQSALLAQGLLVMRTLGTLEGGPNITPPGKSTEVVLNLPAGQYAVLAPIPAKDGVRQYLKGMIAPVTVSGASNVNQVQHPSPDRPILLRGFSITVPGTIKVGAETWQVSNQGDQPYEFNLVELAPGKTEQDVITFYNAPAGPPPFVNLGAWPPFRLDSRGGST